MNIRRVTCTAAAGFIATMSIVAATQAAHAGPRGDVVVQADSGLRRLVHYGDLNLRVRPDQKILGARVHMAANDICQSVNNTVEKREDCLDFAVQDAKLQIRRAIARAELLAEGRPVGPPVAISLLIMGN